jgi:hypothetical protein
MIFTKGLAKQLAKKGIRVNAVAPGPVWTALQVTGGQPTNKLPEFGANTPIGRAGQPAELAPLYVLLASDESSFSTGQVFGAVGGQGGPQVESWLPPAYGNKTKMFLAGGAGAAIVSRSNGGQLDTTSVIRRDTHPCEHRFWGASQQL